VQTTKPYGESFLFRIRYSLRSNALHGLSPLRRTPESQAHALFAQRIRNYTAKPIDVEIRRSFGGHAVFHSELEAKNHDYHTVQYAANVKPGERAELSYEVVTHQGRNAKQANLAVENAFRLRD
jgi:hypothetical protein